MNAFFIGYLFGVVVGVVVTFACLRFTRPRSEEKILPPIVLRSDQFRALLIDIFDDSDDFADEEITPRRIH